MEQKNNILYALRKYQAKAILDSLEFLYSKQNKKMISVLPTAAGKSIVIANIAKNLDAPVLCLQPSKELLIQNYNKLKYYGEDAGIYSASLNKKEVNNITYATIGSVYKRPELFEDVRYIIVDECHIMSPNLSETDSSMYRNLFDKLNAKVLGFTATPYRLKSFSFPDTFSQLNMLHRMRPKIFSDIIHATQIKEMVDGGYWSPMIYENYEFNKGGLKINSIGSDYTEESLNDIINQENIIQKTIDKTNQLIKSGRKQIIIFAPTIEISDFLAKKLKIASITSKTNKDKREQYLKRFSQQKEKAICNVNVLAVGYDNQKIDAIINMKPTLSIARYYQQLGRGVRVDLGDSLDKKKDCLVIDFVDNFSLFGKIEDLNLLKSSGIWNLYSGEKLLTHVPFNLKLRSSEFEDELMPIGKYKDEKLKSIPMWYLNWFKNNVDRTEVTLLVFKYIEDII